MLIAGAGGFARQVLASIQALGIAGECVFYDDFSKEHQGIIPAHFKILKSPEEAREHFRADPRFVLATGNPVHRYDLCQKFETLGAKAYTLVDPDTRISSYGTQVGDGSTILQGVIIEPGVQVGKGVLLNLRAMLTHDCYVGDFSEISPSAVLLGACKIGRMCMIGAGAIVLPGIQIGDFAVVGAGAVVTENIAERETRVGVPARLKKKF